MSISNYFVGNDQAAAEAMVAAAVATVEWEADIKSLRKSWILHFLIHCDGKCVL